MIANEGLRARVLVVGDSPEIAHVITHELQASGHRVVQIAERADTVFAARAQRPEAIVIEGRVSDPLLLNECRQLRDDPVCGVNAVIVVSPSRPKHNDLIAAFAAGAWHVCTPPLDFDELQLRIAVYAAARRDHERASAANLVDLETGLYNAAGLARRGRELSSAAMRQHSELAVVAMSGDAGVPLPGDTVARCGHVLRSIGRLSDVLGRLGPMEFLVLAPGTGNIGAARLARRMAAGLRTALTSALPAGTDARVRAGFAALPNLAYSPVDPTEILARAAVALRVGELSPEFDWISPSEIQELSARA